MLTSINKEGTKKGFDIELNKKISETVKIPNIRSTFPCEAFITWLFLHRLSCKFVSQSMRSSAQAGKANAFMVKCKKTANVIIGLNIIAF